MNPALYGVGRHPRLSARRAVPPGHQWRGDFVNEPEKRLRRMKLSALMPTIQSRCLPPDRRRGPARVGRRPLPGYRDARWASVTVGRPLYPANRMVKELLDARIPTLPVAFRQLMMDEGEGSQGDPASTLRKSRSRPSSDKCDQVISSA
jgi:hypothetical protein